MWLKIEVNGATYAVKSTGRYTQAKVHYALFFVYIAKGFP